MKLRSLTNIFQRNLPTLPLKVLTNHHNTMPIVTGLPTAAAVLHHVIAVVHHVTIAGLLVMIDMIIKTYQGILKNSQIRSTLQ